MENGGRTGNGWGSLSGAGGWLGSICGRRGPAAEGGSAQQFERSGMDGWAARVARRKDDPGRNGTVAPGLSAERPRSNASS